MDQRLNHSPAQLAEPWHSAKGAPRNLAPPGCVTTYFQQTCPACGCRLLILVEHLGQRVSCSHCGRALVARDVSQDRHDKRGVGSSILDRAERLLAMLGSPRGNHRTCNI